jgi:sensor c-di-GMP phosphodiesterase-like protein
MMLIPRSRLRVVLLALLLAGALGAIGGYRLGRALVRRTAESRIQAALAIHAAHLQMLMDEARSLLTALNASKLPYCSNQERSWARNLLYHSDNLRDLGRMRGGKMACSALYDGEKLPAVSFQAKLVRQDGIRIYRDLPPYASGNHAVYLLQRGDSYVVEDPNYVNHWSSHEYGVETSMFDTLSGKWLRPAGLPSSLPGAQIDRTSHGLTGDMLFATSCAPHDASCTTVYASFSATLRASRRELVIDASLGAVCGALLVTIYLLFYAHRQSMGQQLRRAIRGNRLCMVYQPIVELESGHIVEAEALLRWTDEDGFAVSPMVFVKVAEEQGFIGELTRFVINRVLAECGQLLRSNGNFRLNVNVAALDLADENFLPMLEESLATAGVAPQSLTIELTEDSTARKAVAMEAIAKLRDCGHTIQIDDFGTGYSSLSYLHDLHADGIKIDKLFTHAIGTEAMTATILPQILTMADSLNLQVIAEGIETEEQANFFAHRTRPVLGQGWLFGHPVPAEEFLRTLNSQK